MLYLLLKFARVYNHFSAFMLTILSTSSNHSVFFQNPLAPQCHSNYSALVLLLLQLYFMTFPGAVKGLSSVSSRLTSSQYSPLHLFPSSLSLYLQIQCLKSNVASFLFMSTDIQYCFTETETSCNPLSPSLILPSKANL